MESLSQIQRSPASLNTNGQQAIADTIDVTARLKPGETIHKLYCGPATTTRCTFVDNQALPGPGVPFLRNQSRVLSTKTDGYVEAVKHMPKSGAVNHVVIEKMPADAKAWNLLLHIGDSDKTFVHWHGENHSVGFILDKAARLVYRMPDRIYTVGSFGEDADAASNAHETDRQLFEDMQEKFPLPEGWEYVSPAGSAYHNADEKSQHCAVFQADMDSCRYISLEFAYLVEKMLCADQGNWHRFFQPIPMQELPEKIAGRSVEAAIGKEKKSQKIHFNKAIRPESNRLLCYVPHVEFDSVSQKLPQVLLNARLRQDLSGVLQMQKAVTKNPTGHRAEWMTHFSGGIRKNAKYENIDKYSYANQHIGSTTYRTEMRTKTKMVRLAILHDLRQAMAEQNPETKKQRMLSVAADAFIYLGARLNQAGMVFQQDDLLLALRGKLTEHKFEYHSMVGMELAMRQDFHSPDALKANVDFIKSIEIQDRKHYIRFLSSAMSSDNGEMFDHFLNKLVTADSDESWLKELPGEVARAFDRINEPALAAKYLHAFFDRYKNEAWSAQCAESILDKMLRQPGPVFNGMAKNRALEPLAQVCTPREILDRLLAANERSAYKDGLAYFSRVYRNDPSPDAAIIRLLAKMNAAQFGEDTMTELRQGFRDLIELDVGRAELFIAGIKNASAFHAAFDLYSQSPSFVDADISSFLFQATKIKTGSHRQFLNHHAVDRFITQKEPLDASDAMYLTTLLANEKDPELLRKYIPAILTGILADNRYRGARLMIAFSTLLPSLPEGHDMSAIGLSIDPLIENINHASTSNQIGISQLRGFIETALPAYIRHGGKDAEQLVTFALSATKKVDELSRKEGRGNFDVKFKHLLASLKSAGHEKLAQNLLMETTA